MQAVILAGGAGTRLRPITATRPKPLVPIVNVPLVRRLVDRLPREVDEVFVTVNYQGDKLADYFRDRDVGRRVHVVEEETPLGTAGAVRNVADRITGTFVVLNGDILQALDLDAMCRFHHERGGLGTISLRHVADPRPYGIVAMDDHRIVRFVEKPERREDAPSSLANAGTYVFEPAIFQHMPDGPASFERDVFPRILDADQILMGFPFQGYWVDAGRPHTFLKANELALEEGNERVAIGANTQNHGAHFEDWAVVGTGCDLAHDCEITRSVLFNGVRLAQDAVVHDSILGDGVIVEEGAAVVDCVVGDDALISKGVFLKSVKIEPGEHVGEVHG